MAAAICSSNQQCQWCNQPLIGASQLPNCTAHTICNKCRINTRSCQSACPCCWYLNGTEFIDKNRICSVCRSSTTPNSEMSFCYHRHKHCSRCSSSGCILCKFVELRSWTQINSFDDFPLEIKPIIAVCDIWEKQFEEAQQLNCITSVKSFDTQDSITMDIDDGPMSTQNPSLIKSNTQDMQSYNCPICLDDLGISSVTLPICRHQFHGDCISKWFQLGGKETCPTCGYLYGISKGPQPPHGQMVVRYVSTPLPGFANEQYAPNEGPTLEIVYTIPSGIQGPLNPHPGQPYTGTVRTAYLPNNAEGKYALTLLRRAFDDLHIFTIGRSTTTGAENVVTWNDIHHKTNMSAGAENFGYPDPTYLSRLRRELADKGYK